MKTVIYLIRHGQSIGNKMRYFLGHTDVDLTELGYEQARATANALADVKFDYIYSSDLMRAMSTAKPNAELRSMDVIPVRGLREMYVGEWENVAIDDIIERYKEKFTVEWKEQFGTFRAPGGESTPELAARFKAALTEIAERHPGKCICCATHAAAIKAFWGDISGIKPEELASAMPFPSNASYSVVEYEDGVFTPVSYSNDAHLEGMFTTWRD